MLTALSNTFSRIQTFRLLCFDIAPQTNTKSPQSSHQSPHDNRPPTPNRDQALSSALSREGLLTEDKDTFETTHLRRSRLHAVFWNWADRCAPTLEELAGKGTVSLGTAAFGFVLDNRFAETRGFS